AAIESWLQRNIKTAVAGQQSRVLAVLLNPFFVDDKHRNFRTILRRVPNLLDVIGRRIDGGRVDLGPARALHVAQLHAINRGRHGEGLESEEDFVTVIPAGGAENISKRR